MIKASLFLLFLTLVSITSCTDVKFFIANAPSNFENIQIQNDIMFDQEHKLFLDLYSPQKPIRLKNKIIVFFHGGGWTSGTKEQYRFLSSSLAGAGYHVIIPNYRKYPDVKFPDFMFDSAKAVKWVHIHRSKILSKDSDIILMGHSAGANIAFLLITDPKYQVKNKITGGIGLSGPYNFTPNTNILRNIFSPNQYHDMRPITYVDGTEPPLWMGYGLQDNLVARFNIDTMAKKLEKHGVCHKAILYPENDHASMIAEFSWVGGHTSKVRQDVLRFLNDIESKNLCKK